MRQSESAEETHSGDHSELDVEVAAYGHALVAADLPNLNGQVPVLVVDMTDERVAVDMLAHRPAAVVDHSHSPVAVVDHSHNLVAALNSNLDRQQRQAEVTVHLVEQRTSDFGVPVVRHCDHQTYLALMQPQFCSANVHCHRSSLHT